MIMTTVTVPENDEKQAARPRRVKSAPHASDGNVGPRSSRSHRRAGLAGAGAARAAAAARRRLRPQAEHPRHLRRRHRLWNVSAYNRGMMGYRTPNIDRIAKEGAIFTDHYAQQSCTAGRAAFITGQSCFRTGLLKVGLPGAKEGLSDKDPTLAELLKPQGYATGQFGKNHLGDRNEFLPTVHGFDEFFGNLYHLNAEEEPENPDYPKDPEFRAKFGPRGVLNAWRPTGTIRPRTRASAASASRRSRTPARSRASAWRRSTRSSSPRAGLHRPAAQGRQAVLLLVQHHAHAHLHPPQAGVERQDRPRPCRRRHGRARRHGRRAVEETRRPRHRRQHHRHLDDRQRRRVFSWPDGGTTPFKGEKNTNWEGGYRVPCACAGPVSSSPAPRSTRSSRMRIWCRRSSPPPASRTSRRSC